jgi:hypothetical protein
MKKAIKQAGEQMKAAMLDDRVEICQRCTNIYTIIWLKSGDDYNDFGLRYCPFCGLLADELTGSVMT